LLSNGECLLRARKSDAGFSEQQPEQVGMPLFAKGLTFVVR
jgi:hypothetical protein